VHRAVLAASLAALLAAPAALAQVPIPAHARVYNGLSRGYNFTANTNFVITQLGLPPEAFQAGDTAGYMVRINGVEVLRSVGNAGNINTAILVNSGDVVDVIGNWSPVPPGYFTAHNSYGAGPFNTTIEGVPHVINRCGWQWDISDPAYTGGTYLAPTSGEIGRVLMWTSAPSGFATALPFGSGCGGGGPASFYERFDAARPNDLSNHQGLSAFWTGPTYVIVPGATPVVPPSAGQLTMTDDLTVQVPLPWTLPTPAGPINDVFVCSNGWVSLLPTTETVYTETVAGLLGAATPRILGLWDDLNPAAGGGVYAAVDPANPTLFHITWDQVPELGATGTANTVQITLSQSGGWELKFGAIAAIDGLVGYSPGGGARDPGPTDISALAGPLVLGDDRPELSLNPTARPVLGQTAATRTEDIPAGAVAGFHAYSVGAIPSPGLDLSGFGMPGCFLYGSNDIAVPFGVAQPTAQHSLAVPNNPSLAGQHLYTQSIVLVPGINALGVITSNGVDWKIDLR
jgi:hypothetical protein